MSSPKETSDGSARFHSDLVLGVDGGGSHTITMLAERTESGAVLAQGMAGPSNIQAVGVERAQQALDEAVTQAFANLGRPRGMVAAAALGLAGIDHEVAEAVVRDWCARVRLAERVDVSNDATLLLAGGTPNGWGLAVIAGTGSIAFARAPDARMARSGGWGYLLGDEGSAYRLALHGLQAVARAADGCAPETLLTRRTLAMMQLGEPVEMIHAVYRGGWDRSRLASLAPVVLTAAEEGDAVAQQIVAAEARELAKTAAAAARKLALPSDGLPLALTGGTILNSAGYRGRFLSAFAELGVRAEPITLVPEPAEGAVRVARKLLSPLKP
jgi:N-acetylglucosamine kinase-like BadF-type ATPase